MWTQASSTISVPTYPCSKLYNLVHTPYYNHPFLTPGKHQHKRVYVTSFQLFFRGRKFFLSMYFYKILDIPPL